MSVPERLGSTIIRSQLVGRLESLAPGTLVKLVAGAGYGKSTVLEQWARHSARHFEVIAVQPSDNDVQHLGEKIATAVANAGLDGARPILERARSLEPDWICELLPALVHTVAKSDLVLALDDVHHLSSARANEFVTALVALWPRTSTLVFSGRPQRNVRLLHPRFGEPMHVVSEVELDFDEDEMRVLLADDFGDRASDIYRRTGGWPAGLRLTALQSDRGDRSGPGSPYSVSEYLDREVLSAFDAIEIDLLADLAVIAPAPARLIDDTLIIDARTVVEDFRGRGLPLVRVTGPESVITIHSLLADLLVARLRSRDEERFQAVLRRAANLAMRNGPKELAFTLTERSGDQRRLDSFPYRHLGELFCSGHIATLGSWLERFPIERIRNEPLLAIPAGIAARPFSEIVFRDLLRPFESDTTTLMPDGVTVAQASRAALVAGGLEHPTADDDRLPYWRPIMAGLWGFALFAADRLTEGRLQLQEVCDLQNPFPLQGTLDLARLAAFDADTGRGSEVLELLSDAAATQPATDIGLTFLLDAVRAQLAAAAGDQTQAEASADTMRRKLAMSGDFLQLEQLWSFISVANVFLDFGTPSIYVRSLYEEAKTIADGRRAHDIRRFERSLRALRDRLESAPTRHVAVRPQVLLTTAELRVLHYLPSHYSLPRIAQELNRSPATVKTQSISIYRKLGVAAREDAVAEATRLGLVGAPVIARVAS